MNDESDRRAIAATLAELFPDPGAIEPHQVLSRGFSSLAMASAGDVVFRIARTAEAGAFYVVDHDCLPILAGRLPVAVPQPRWYAPASPAFPRGVIGYPRLAGRPLDTRDFTAEKRKQFAQEIGALLAALHAINAARPPLAQGLQHLPPPVAQRTRWAETRKICMPALVGLLTSAEYAAVDAWWENFLTDDLLFDYTPTLIHGDLWYGNLLTDGRTVTGLIDFELLGIGDPVLDLVPQLYLGSPAIPATTCTPPGRQTEPK